MKKNSSIALKRCLVTGGLGYLGRHVVKFLEREGWAVETLGLKPDNTYTCDLAVQQPAFHHPFDLVVHCAGLAHFFPKSAEEKAKFKKINVMGTENLLKGLAASGRSPNGVVLMSSVSVYGAENGKDVEESAPLKANTAYGISKIGAEKAILSWAKEMKFNYLLLRLPLLAGKEPPGNLKSIIQSISQGYYINLFEDVRKSIVLAEDVAKIVPLALNHQGVYNLTDGVHPSIADLAGEIAQQLGKKKPMVLSPLLASLLKKLVKNFAFLAPIYAYKFEKLSKTLTFSDSKARRELGWNPRSVLESFKIR